MNKILTIILAFLITSPILMAEDLVLVAAKLKIDAYSSKDMSYLGKFVDLSKIMKPTCMTTSKDGKLIVAGTGLATSGKSNIIIKINKDGDLGEIGLDGNFAKIDYFYQQDIRNTPIDSPKAIVELDDGSIVLFDSAKHKIFKFASTGGAPEDFLKSGEEQAVSSRFNTIFKYNNSVIVASSDPTYTLVQYDADGSLEENLTIGNDFIRNPFHISKIDNGYIMVALALVEIDGVKKQVSTLLELNNSFIFTKKLISDKDIEKKSLLKPMLALKSEENGKLLILDGGRNRTGTVSYDDNLELFSKDGEYEKSLGTYPDTLVRYIMLFKGSTKKW